MINHLRIDNRLIHGQVAVMWRSNVAAEAIIVCNDKVAADPIQKMALPLSCKGEKVLMFSSRCSGSDIPESMQSTFGRLPTYLNAHDATLESGAACFRMAVASGEREASAPPLNGSMITSGTPASVAISYCSLERYSSQSR